jgi:hypothetical protein
MSSLFYLSVEQHERIHPCFPLSHGISRVGDMEVTSGKLTSSSMVFKGQFL